MIINCVAKTHTNTPTIPTINLVADETSTAIGCSGRGAECDHIVGVGAGEGAGAIVVSVTVSAWARILEELRVRAWLARVWSRVRTTAAILRLPERFTRALTRHPLSSTILLRRYLQLRRTRAVQIHHAPSRRAVPTASLRLHRHGQGGGAAIAGDTGELSGGVLGAEGSAPQAAGPGGGDGEGVRLTGLKGKAGGGELCSSGVGQNAWPYSVEVSLFHLVIHILFSVWSIIGSQKGSNQDDNNPKLLEAEELILDIEGEKALETAK
ncbi:hypothetical protein G2W53_020131 [Senna tora]|uniref:Uncharacterized protein n=1 Tax=Senna tora TaxID=362788 RepID=A0A834WN78_9FABA|nr:hypothetical protein G2W53_020131 [Senna tora]